MAGAMPQNHARTLREQKPLSRRAKQLFALAGAVIIAGIVVMVIATSGTKTEIGCVHTTLPGVIGAQTLDECGQEAKQTCSSVKESERQFGTVGVIIVEKACAKGHLAVG